MPPKHRLTSAIILAGGLGTRLREAVPDVPKPMAPIRGRPFLEFQLAYWIGQGIDRFVLAVGYRHQAIVDHFGSRFQGARLDYAVEEEPMGTGGGFLRAAQMLAPAVPFLLLNGDTYFEVNLQDLDAFASSRGADWCFSVFRRPLGERYAGIELAADGRVSTFRSPAGPLGNGGVYWIHPRALETLATRGGKPLSLEDDLLPSAQPSGLGMYALECAGTFIDIGVPADYQRAQQLLPDLAISKGLS